MAVTVRNGRVIHVVIAGYFDRQAAVQLATEGEQAQHQASHAVAWKAVPGQPLPKPGAVVRFDGASYAVVSCAPSKITKGVTLAWVR